MVSLDPPMASPVRPPTIRLSPFVPSESCPNDREVSSHMKVIARYWLAAAGLAVTISSDRPQHPMTGVEQARMDSIRRPYTKADIAFMSGMISHHAQAVKMASWAPTHGASKSLQIYCGRVAMAQTAEIGLMQQWLRERNQPVPDADPKGMKMAMAGMENMADMPGMSVYKRMPRSEEHTSELQSRFGISYAVL